MKKYVQQVQSNFVTLSTPTASELFAIRNTNRSSVTRCDVELIR